MTPAPISAPPAPHAWSCDRPNRPASRVRRLGPADRDMLERHLLGLSRADRYARFQATVTDPAIVAYVRGLDLRRVIIVGAFDEGGALVGLAEAHLSGARPLTAELAVSVASDWRRRGLGHDVTRAAADAAFGRGADLVCLFFAGSNAPLIGLARSLGCETSVATGCATLKAQRPTILSH